MRSGVNDMESVSESRPLTKILLGFMQDCAVDENQITCVTFKVK